MRLPEADLSPLIRYTLVALLTGSSLSDYPVFCGNRAPSLLRETEWLLQACSNLTPAQRPLLEAPLRQSDVSEAANKRYIQAVPAPMLEPFIRHGASQLTPSSKLVQHGASPYFAGLSLTQLEGTRSYSVLLVACSARTATGPAVAVPVARGRHSFLRSSLTLLGPIQYVRSASLRAFLKHTACLSSWSKRPLLF